MMQKMTRETEQSESVQAKGHAVAAGNATGNVVKQSMASDVILTDDQGERIAAMREYVFLNLAVGN